MLAVYICDDQAELTERFREYIENYILMRDYDLRFVCAATTAQEILDAASVQDSGTIGLYFLDIDLKADIDGLKLAAQIRTLDPSGFIVFITSHGEHIGETFRYHLEAFDYIIKDSPDNLKHRIWNCLDSAYQRFVQITVQGENYLSVKVGNQERFLLLAEILYISTSPLPHQLKILTKHELIQIRGDLNRMLVKLNESFFRNDKSCIVNLNHIQSIDYANKRLLLDNGEEKPLSVRSIGKIRKYLKSQTHLGG